MKKLHDLLVVVLFVGLLCAPVVNMWGLVAQAPLDGVFVEKKRPAFSFSGLANETFQHGVISWFEQAYGLRPSLVRLDNSIDYVAFHEARPDKTVKVGRNEVLFFDDQVNHWNRAWSTDLKRYALRIRAARDALASRGILLELILVPTKTSVWESALPPRWNRSISGPRPSQVGDATFRRELDAASVQYIDGNVVLADLIRSDPRAVYAPAARHVTAAAACLMLDALARDVRAQRPQHAVAVPSCGYRMAMEGPGRFDDFDLHRLLNVWVDPPPTPTPLLDQTSPAAPADGKRLRTLVVGSSFGWQVVKEAKRNELFDDLQFHYYGVTLFGPGEERVPMPLGSDEWKRLLLSKDLVFFVVPEEFFGDERAEFFVETIRALGSRDAETLALLP